MSGKSCERYTLFEERGKTFICAIFSRRKKHILLIILIFINIVYKLIFII